MLFVKDVLKNSVKLMKNPIQNYLMHVGLLFYVEIVFWNGRNLRNEVGQNDICIKGRDREGN